MRSLVAIFLSCLILGSSWLPGFSIDQSAKWSELIQHYHQHLKESTNLSFLDFLAMHYGANSEHQKHPTHSHHNLPAAGHSVPVFTPTAVRLVAISAIHLVVPDKTSFSRKADLYSFLAVFSLINPPRA